MVAAGPVVPPSAVGVSGGFAGVPCSRSAFPTADFVVTCAPPAVPFAIACPRGPLRWATSPAVGTKYDAPAPVLLGVARFPPRLLRILRSWVPGVYHHVLG